MYVSPEAAARREFRACQDALMVTPPFDLVIRNGAVITPGHREIADIGVRDGRIAEIGGTLSGPEEIDADGLLVLPGGIDAHVHLVYAALAAELSGLVRKSVGGHAARAWGLIFWWSSRRFSRSWRSVRVNFQLNGVAMAL
jgi:imidazolonepropionase-like amidohydrolase